MTSFIDQVLEELLSRDTNISDYVFVLPSKRAGSFLLNKLASKGQKSFFAPHVISIEEFAEEIAQTTSLDTISALFECYTAYRAITPDENIEDFDNFSSWAQTLLHDFNEIDRYLIDPKAFFDYLGNIQEINHWFLQEERTPLMENYLSFWNRMPQLYEQLRKQMESQNMAYQGMVYRKAAENIESFTGRTLQNFVFIGFNALNAAEQTILKKMLNAGKAEVFWDIDEAFLKDEQHEVSFFLRKYFKEWDYYREHKPQMGSSGFTRAKKIDMVGIPRNIGQAKYVGELLSKLSSEEIKKTAVILGDESLMIPLLNSLPPTVEEVNVTMGFPLKNAPVAFLFEQLLRMHSTSKSSKWYFKDVTSICNHPLIQKVTAGFSTKLSEKIKNENLVYLTEGEIVGNLEGRTLEIYRLCFGNWKNDPQKAVKNLQELIYALKSKLDPEKDKLSLEFLYRFHTLFNQLDNLLEKYNYIQTLKTLFSIFKDLLSTQTVDFQGRPFSGLQLMGVLESRVLDFDNVIVTSVNEGVLPAGKSNNSFVPFDLKCLYNLPTYKEKDAVYAYHFYHLLQRAENVHLLYNTESDGLNAGEKSRFLLQLEMEQQENHIINKFNVAPTVPPIKKQLKSVEKTPAVLQKLQELAESGFSPSALTTYIRNPLDFYKRYILGIQDPEEVEETIAFNTLGSVVHDTLEIFYKPLVNCNLEEQHLEDALKRTGQVVEEQFKKHYTKAPLNSGKNLLILEVAKRFVTNFLKQELKLVKKGNTIRIKNIEDKLKCLFSVPGLQFPVYLKGTVDRVDEYNGVLRIVDYKTGRVDQNKVEIVDWEDISSDYDNYSKPFQILTYTCLLENEISFSEPIEAGIISFKNLQNGFLKFTKKDRKGRGAKKDSEITLETLEAFKEQLQNLILEIFDPGKPFIEKEIKQSSW